MIGRIGDDDAVPRLRHRHEAAHLSLMGFPQHQNARAALSFKVGQIHRVQNGGAAIPQQRCHIGLFGDMDLMKCIQIGRLQPFGRGVRHEAQFAVRVLCPDRTRNGR